MRANKVWFSLMELSITILRERDHEKEDIHFTQLKAWCDVLSVSSSHFTHCPNVQKKKKLLSANWQINVFAVWGNQTISPYPLPLANFL